LPDRFFRSLGDRMLYEYEQAYVLRCANALEPLIIVVSRPPLGNNPDEVPRTDETR
jgi:hypothetical protein